MSSTLEQIIVAERQAKIDRVSELLQFVFDAEPKDWKLEKTYDFDSLFRHNIRSFFCSFMAHDSAHASNIEAAQWPTDIALQLIARRLLNLFDDQERQRDRIAGVILGSTSISKKDLRSMIAKEDDIASAIGTWKSLFHELLGLAKQLDFEVFERQAYQYQLYNMLELKRKALK